MAVGARGLGLLGSCSWCVSASAASSSAAKASSTAGFFFFFFLPRVTPPLSTNLPPMGIYLVVCSCCKREWYTDARAVVASKCFFVPGLSNNHVQRIECVFSAFCCTEQHVYNTWKPNTLFILPQRQPYVPQKYRAHKKHTESI